MKGEHKMIDGIAAAWKSEVVDACHNTHPRETLEALRGACGIEGYKRYTTVQQLRIFKKYVPILLDMYDLNIRMMREGGKQVKRYEGQIGERHKKRWTDEEDRMLIEFVGDGASMTEAATMMGRTPGAIASRITYLVGVSRLSQEIAGNFLGTIDGETVSGHIDGTLTFCDKR